MFWRSLHEMLLWTVMEELAWSGRYSLAASSVHWVLAKEQDTAFLKHNCENRCLILTDLRETVSFQKKQSKLWLCHKQWIPQFLNLKCIGLWEPNVTLVSYHRGKGSWQECPSHKPPLTKATWRLLLHKLVLPQILCAPGNSGCVCMSKLCTCHCLYNCSIAQGLCKENEVYVLYYNFFFNWDYSLSQCVYLCYVQLSACTPSNTYRKKVRS